MGNVGDRRSKEGFMDFERDQGLVPSAETPFLSFALAYSQRRPSPLPPSASTTMAGDLLSSTHSGPHSLEDSVFAFGRNGSTRRAPSTTTTTITSEMDVDVIENHPIEQPDAETKIDKTSSKATTATRETATDSPRKPSKYLWPRKRRRTVDEEEEEDDDHYLSNEDVDPPSSVKKNDSFQYHQLPHLITGYIQVFFTFFIAATLVYIITSFLLTVHRDFRLKREEHSQELMQQIGACTKAYIENKCEPSERIPAIESLCKEWEICMRRHPDEVAGLHVGAGLLAEILNRLIEPLSYKTMGFGLILLMAMSLFASSAFSLLRRQEHSRDGKREHQQIVIVRDVVDALDASSGRTLSGDTRRRKLGQRRPR